MSRRPWRIPWPFLLAGAALLVGLFLIRQALAPFFMAMVLAYLLSPLHTRLSRSMGRPLAALALLGATILALLALLRLLVPPLVTQFERLIHALPALRHTIETRWLVWLVEQHPASAAHLKQTLDSFDTQHILEGLQVAGAGFVTLFLRLLTGLLVPIMLYYLLVDGPRLLGELDALLPPRHRRRIHILLANIHLRLGGFIRGQLAVAAVMSTLQGLAFFIQGTPYAFLLGLLAGFANLVPYSPYVTALPLALLLAGLQGATWGSMLTLTLVFVAVQKVEALYLTPVWIGRASRLHPLEVLLAVLAFGSAFGLLGLIFAVPMAIIIKVVLEQLRQDYQAHPWFQGETPDE